MRLPTSLLGPGPARELLFPPLVRRSEVSEPRLRRGACNSVKQITLWINVQPGKYKYSVITETDSTDN